jgi:tRNA(Ile)-lysidine synthase
MLREDADALDAVAAGLAETAVRRRPGGPDGPDGVDVDVAAVARTSAAVRHRVLLGAAREAGCPPGDLTRAHVLAVDALVTRWRGQGPLHLPGGVRAERACGRLVLARASAPDDAR